MLTPHDIFSILENHEERRAPVRQDKEALPRFSAASPQASTATKPALNDRANRASSTSHTHKHSTKRQKVFAGSWVSRETDAYIEHRLHEGRKGDPNLSRSAVIRMMLEERALDATIATQHAILAPLIRETMHQKFQVLANQIGRAHV